MDDMGNSALNVNERSDNLIPDMVEIQLNHLDLTFMSHTQDNYGVYSSTYSTYSVASDVHSISTDHRNYSYNQSSHFKCSNCSMKYTLSSSVNVYAKIPHEILKELNGSKNKIAKILMNRLRGNPKIVMLIISIVWLFLSLIIVDEILFASENHSHPLAYLYTFIPVLIIDYIYYFLKMKNHKSKIDKQFGAYLKIDDANEANFINTFSGVIFYASISNIKISTDQLNNTKVKHEYLFKWLSEKKMTTTYFNTK